MLSASPRIVGKTIVTMERPIFHDHDQGRREASLVWEGGVDYKFT